MLPFQQFSARESKGDWLKHCRTVLTNPQQHEAKVVVPEGADARVLYTVDLSAEAFRVTTLRTLAHALTSTVVRRIIMEWLARAAATGRTMVEVYERNDVVACDALRELGFHEIPNGFAKVTVASIAKSSDVAGLVQQCSGGSVSGALGGVTEDPEHRFWPLKIRDTETASYLIPIRPSWAAQLFDMDLANRDLFGADERIGLALENVYYSASPVSIPKGARILWYVSKDGGKGQVVREVRACSYSLGTVRDAARRVFRQFSRLGVYRWADVLRTAKDEPMGQVTAYPFTLTERLPKPVSFDRVQELLEGHGAKRNQIAGPTRISAEVFTAIYAEATGRHA